MSIYYLYVKTHNKTGLKYLGYTASQDPHKYPGSGKYWRYHLEKHGYDYTTTILKECQHPAMIKFWGEHYSDFWNVVESDEWANLKPESGDGGASPVVWNKGKKIGYTWTNGQDFVIQFDCPGPDWVRGSPTKGRLYANKSVEAKSRSGHKGTAWWNNGTECKRSESQPGLDWIKGFINPSTGSKGMHWWNNGEKSIMAFECPDSGWVRGRLKKTPPTSP